MSLVSSALLKPELVFVDIDLADRSALFKFLERELLARGYVRPSWHEAIVEREKNYPTGLDCEAIQVAIPHTDPEHIVEPYIAIVRPRASVLFEGMAGLPDVQAQLIVNLGLQAHEDEQVKALQTLMGIFTDIPSVEELLRQDDARGLHDVFAAEMNRL